MTAKQSHTITMPNSADDSETPMFTEKREEKTIHRARRLNRDMSEGRLILSTTSRTLLSMRAERSRADRASASQPKRNMSCPGMLSPKGSPAARAIADIRLYVNDANGFVIQQPPKCRLQLDILYDILVAAY